MLNVRALVVAAVAGTVSATAGADTVQIRVTAQSLAGANGVSFSPVSFGFHDGTFDPWDSGAAPSPGVQRIAELGLGDVWMAELAANQASAVSGAVVATTGGFGPGIFLPGGSGSTVFTLDTALNRYMSYGSMAVPSNDRFIANDSPTQHALFDAGGVFIPTTIMVAGAGLWDAGTEVNAPFGAAFIVGQNAEDHVDENGVVHPDFDFGVYAGSQTPAGYTFSNLPTATTPLFSITFEVVPAPGSLALLGAATLAAGRRRRSA